MTNMTIATSAHRGREPPSPVDTTASGASRGRRRMWCERLRPVPKRLHPSRPPPCVMLTAAHSTMSALANGHLGPPSPSIGRALCRGTEDIEDLTARFLGGGYAAFPTRRFTVLRSWDPLATSGLRGNATRTTLSSSSSTSNSHQRWLRKEPAMIAIDRAHAGRHVLLTAIPKAAASRSQIDHARRVMRMLGRASGFQRLLGIHEHQGAWVFVQEFDELWEPLVGYWTTRVFSEELLRRMTFEVVAMVHFLHAHGYGASGLLRVDEDFVVNPKTERLTWLVSPALVLSGCLLMDELPRRRARDISAVGLFMFQLSMLSHAAEFATVERFEDLELLIHEQLEHLSAPCRQMILECLNTPLTIDDVAKRKWLRHVDFVSHAPKHDLHVIQHAHRSALNALLWKLATFIASGGLVELHQMAAMPSAVKASEDEEVESTRQRSRKTSRRHQYSGRRLLLSGHHGFGSTGTMLKRGIVIVPPLIPEDHDEDEVAGNQQKVFPFAASDEDAAFHGDVDVYGHSSVGYDTFRYDFPGQTISPGASTIPEDRTYDPFDGDEYFLIESTGLNGDFVEDADGRRERVSSILLHENGHSNSSLASLSDITKGITRSIHPQDDDWNTRGLHPESKIPHDEYLWSKESMDAVHVSAFGPEDIAFRETFRLDIWAYLRQQRQEMLQSALEQNESEVAQRVRPLEIARGTLITVSIDASQNFSVIGEECKSFRWRGEVNGVSFEMARKTERSCSVVDEDDELCVARIVAGTKVSLLYIRLHSSNSHTMSGIASLSTKLEHVYASVPDISTMDVDVVRPIGRGAFGEAVLAVWKPHNTHVVIKTPRHDAFRASDVVEAFRHEAAVMHMLGKHPHVVELLGLLSQGTDDTGPAALVTEYLPKGSLHDLLIADDQNDHKHNDASSSPWSLFSKTVMARDAAHGIVNIHQGHVLHRDIAARNCLLDEQFRVKVCDFGLSRLSRAGLYFDDDSHGFGPVKWMAPESVLPPHLFSTQSDSYMFGVLMYEIFSGQLPFAGLSSRETIALILEGHHVPIPDGLPPAHTELMRQCFDPHPLSRPSMDQIYMSLDQWILSDTRELTRKKGIL